MEVADVRSTLVRDVMTTNVVAVKPDATFKAVVRALEDRGVDAAPVVDTSGALLGVVSESDLTCHDEQPGRWTEVLLGGKDQRSHRRKARARTAEALMTAPAVSVSSGTSVCEAVRLMGVEKVGRLMVVDNGRLVGILTRSDVLRCYLRDDAELQRDVEAAVSRAVGDCPARLDVEVTDGVATVAGWVERTSAALAALSAAGQVAGVVDVEDELLSDIDDTVVHEMSVRGPFV